MTPEQLKVIAEGIGYEVKICFESSFSTVQEVWIKKGYLSYFHYVPLTNDRQTMEIMIKCGISVMVDNQGEGRYATVWDTDISIHELFTDEDESAMVRRLICKAAYEDLKEKDGD